MELFYGKLAAGWQWAALLLGLAGAARAQAPAWGGAVFGTTGQASGGTGISAVATDAGGNVFVTGGFTGTVVFGGTVLTSRGNADMFVAKYVPATASWAWAVSGGGTDSDSGTGIAVNGSSIYVLGDFTNSITNANSVFFGGTGSQTGTVPVRGATAATNPDIFLTKLIDQGSSATLAWAQVAGGTAADYSAGLAVSGTSLYVVASIQNDVANTNGVLFGGNGSAVGTVAVRGATTSTTLDLCLAKYVDLGSSAALAWTQIGGGTNQDFAEGVAVSGASVYVTGTLWNNAANANGALFGSNGTAAGTTTVRGVSAVASPDWLLAKYTDNGGTATLGWTQVAGGASYDVPAAVAASGTNVYLVGNIRNNAANANAVLFGGSGTTAGTVTVRGVAATSSPDLVLAKYTDGGRAATLGWVQVGGGSGEDGGLGLAVGGGSIYVAGAIENNAANANAVLFGSNGTTAGTAPVSGISTTVSNDLLVAKYLDNGSSAALAWTQVGGGPSNDVGFAVALAGQQVYVAGRTVSPSTFGPATTTVSANVNSGVLAYLTDTALTPLATQPTNSRPALTLYPNPAPGRATLGGVVPGMPVQVLDTLGRVVATATAAADGTASLVLPAGLYMLRTGTQTARLAVE